jgi:radical SAM superfamily enzyme YgiQ (UPF0313 family)
MGIIPDFVSKRKMDLLYKAGLKRIRMGIQTFHKNTLKNYKRSHKIEKIHNCNNIFQNYKNLVFPYYDIITDNPFTDTEKDILITIQNLCKFKGKFTLLLYSLRFYPGTGLYNLAIKNQIDDFYFNKSYFEYKKNLLNFILTLIQSTNNNLIIKLLLKLYYKKGNIKIPGFMFKITKLLFIFRCGFEHIRKKDKSGLPNILVKFIPKYKKNN